jgi:hypothetical protein
VDDAARGDAGLEQAEDGSFQLDRLPDAARSAQDVEATELEVLQGLWLVGKPGVVDRSEIWILVLPAAGIAPPWADRPEAG